MSQFKSVTYLGVKRRIPKTHKYVATDKCGRICSFKVKPKIKKSPFAEFWRGNLMYMVYERVTLDIKNWDKSLRKYK